MLYLCPDRFTPVTVTDIDECALGINDCGLDLFCVNTPGSYRCHLKEMCPVGFIQDAIGNCNGKFSVAIKLGKKDSVGGPMF